MCVYIYSITTRTESHPPIHWWRQSPPRGTVPRILPLQVVNLNFYFSFLLLGCQPEVAVFLIFFYLS